MNSKAVHSLHHLMLAVVPNTALKAAITAQTAGVGTFVKFTNSANYEVGLCSEGDYANGRIAQLDVQVVTIEVLGYTTTVGEVVLWNPAVGVIEVGYTGSVSLGNSVKVDDGSAYVYAATSGGQGYIIAKDLPTTNRLIMLI